MISKEELRIGNLLWPEHDYWRPVTRTDCANVSRPCPYVACRHNLYLDETRGGSILLNFPDEEPGDLVQSCVLDLAEQGGMVLGDVGAVLGVTRERVRQLRDRALKRLREGDIGKALASFAA